jgi:hypothetical protein
VAAAAIVALALATPAAATTADEAISLLESVANGDRPIADLDQLDQIDGVPIDLVSFVDAAGGDADLAAEIIRSDFTADPGPDVIAAVESILSQERFARSSTTALERWLDRVGSWLTDRMTTLSGGNGPNARISLVAVILVLAVVGLAVRVATRRRATVVRRRHTLDRLIEEGADPAELERQAEAAAARADYAESVRLRFIAGILRLDQQGTIRFTKGLTTGEIAGTLANPVFDDLHRDFDRVVYGDELATSNMDDRARAGWDVLVAKARRP